MNTSSLESLIKNLSLPSSVNTGQFLIYAGGISTMIMLIALWSLVWKGIALWYAARRGEKGWFIWLLVINTLGVLEMIYIFGIAKRYPAPVPKPNSPTPLVRE
jgi:hypothetical protein